MKFKYPFKKLTNYTIVSCIVLCQLHFMLRIKILVGLGLYWFVQEFKVLILN